MPGVAGHCNTPRRALALSFSFSLARARARASEGGRVLGVTMRAQNGGPICLYPCQRDTRGGRVPGGGGGGGKRRGRERIRSEGGKIGRDCGEKKRVVSHAPISPFFGVLRGFCGFRALRRIMSCGRTVEMSVRVYISKDMS